MNTRAPAKPRLPAQRSRDRAPGKPAPSKTPFDSLNHITVLEVVRRATAIEQVSRSAIAEAAKHGNRAGTLLAAMVLHDTISPPQPAASGEPTATSLHAYLNVEAARADIKYLGTTRSVPKQHKEMSRRQSEARIAQHGTVAKEFSVVVAAITPHADELTSRYRTSNGFQRLALVELYDLTDATEHPLLTALPKAAGYNDSHLQAAVVESDRLLRFMISEALSLDEVT